MSVREDIPVPGALTARLTANTIVQAVGGLLSAVLGFFTFVAITRGLGPEAFGDFTAAMAFLFIPIAVADVGLSAAVLREISIAPERTQPAMRASLPLRALVSATVMALAAGIGVAMPFNERTTTAVLIGSLGSFLTLMTLALTPVLQAQLRMYWAVAGHVSGRIVTLVATVAAIAAGFGFEAIVWAYVAGLAVAFAVHAVAVARVVSVRPVIDTRYWRNLFVGSLALGFAIAISQIYFRVDALLLAALRSSEEVGFYGAAYKFVELGQFFSATVAISMFPPLANFVAGNDRRAAKVLIQKAFDVLLAGGVFTGLVMLAFPEEIITLAAGEEFREAAPALQLLAPWTLFGFTLAVLWRVLLASGRDTALLATAVAALVLNVALNLALIPVYGFKAAAVVSVLTEALILAPIALLVSRDGLLPGLRYLPTVAGAGAVLAAILWLLPGPAPLVGVVGSAVYAAILFAVPGAVQEAASSLLVRRPRLLRSRP